MPTVEFFQCVSCLRVFDKEQICPDCDNRPKQIPGGGLGKIIADTAEEREKEMTAHELAKVDTAFYRELKRK